jgi:hypothetical protein
MGNIQRNIGWNITAAFNNSCMVVSFKLYQGMVKYLNLFVVIAETIINFEV